MRHELYERLDELLTIRGGRPCWASSCSLPPFLRGLPLFTYFIFCQMRHELYERLGELLTMRGRAALLGLQLLPASFLAGTTIIHILYILSDETQAV